MRGSARYRVPRHCFPCLVISESFKAGDVSLEIVFISPGNVCRDQGKDVAAEMALVWTRVLRRASLYEFSVAQRNFGC